MNRTTQFATKVRQGSDFPGPAGGLAVGLLLALLPVAAAAQESADLFRNSCFGCHTIGGGRLTGPDLKDVTQRKDRTWLIQFMMNPKSVIDRGDQYALKLLEESRNVVMTTLPGMTPERCEDLLDLIEAESKLEESQFKGQAPTKPFTEANRQLGQEIFRGLHRLENGGPACISCHSMHDVRSLGGGRLGPDLTNIYELRGRQALTAWLMAPATETMQPIFEKRNSKDRNMTPDEIHALMAYFASSAGQSPVQPMASRVALLLMGLAGAAVLVFVFDAIWKRRFHSVRQPLVDALEVRGH